MDVIHGRVSSANFVAYVPRPTSIKRMSTNFLPTTPAYFESMHGDAFGWVVLDADHAHLSLTFINVANDEVMDQVT